MHCAPVPAFPAVGIVVHARHADRIGEAEQRGEVVADVAPGVVRAVRHRDGAGTMLALLAPDLVGDDLDRFVPRDAHVAGLAAVLRIALAVRIEVDPLHRIKQAVRGVDDRLGVLPVRRQRCLARRRELHALGLDGPGRAVVVGEIDRRHADDLAVLDVDEDRPAIGHVAIAHGAVIHAGADLQPRRLAHHHSLGEPVGQVFRPVDREDEILLGVDLPQPVDWRHEEAGADCCVLEHQLAVGCRMQAGAGADRAVLELEPAAAFLVARHDLRGEIALLQPPAERFMPPALEFQHHRQAEQDERELEGREGHAVLPVGSLSASW